jgi:hypothetical protein
LVEKYPNVLIRKVDIVDWDSAAATQASQEFGLQGIPYLRVYGSNGDLLREISGADMTAIEDAIRMAAR